MVQAPAEVGRNEFDEWCWRRGLELRDVVTGLQTAADRIARERVGPPPRVPSIETVRLIRLPFSDSRRRVPSQELVELIHAFTGGEITAAHFYPPHLRGSITQPERLAS